MSSESYEGDALERMEQLRAELREARVLESESESEDSAVPEKDTMVETVRRRTVPVHCSPVCQRDRVFPDFDRVEALASKIEARAAAHCRPARTAPHRDPSPTMDLQLQLDDDTPNDPLLTRALDRITAGLAHTPASPTSPPHSDRVSSSVASDTSESSASPYNEPESESEETEILIEEVAVKEDPVAAAENQFVDDEASEEDADSRSTVEKEDEGSDVIEGLICDKVVIRDRHAEGHHQLHAEWEGKLAARSKRQRQVLESSLEEDSFDMDSIDERAPIPKRRYDAFQDIACSSAEEEEDMALWHSRRSAAPRAQVVQPTAAPAFQVQPVHATFAQSNSFLTKSSSEKDRIRRAEASKCTEAVAAWSFQPVRSAAHHK